MPYTSHTLHVKNFILFEYHGISLFLAIFGRLTSISGNLYVSYEDPNNDGNEATNTNIPGNLVSNCLTHNNHFHNHFIVS
jgi:hypothetical protein